MSEPVRRSYSLEEFRQAALDFMTHEYGLPEKTDAGAREAWYERLGLLTVFATRLFKHPPDQPGERHGNR